jgi:hypothetical protein
MNIISLQADCRVVDFHRHSGFIFPPIETPAPLSIGLNIPPATNLTTPHMTVNMQIYQSLVSEATLNLNIRDELRKAREELECLKRQNHHLLENSQRLNEVNRDLPKASGMMHNFLVGKHEAEITVMQSQMKVNSSHLDTALEDSEIKKNNIRQRLDYILWDLNAERRNHKTLKNTHSQWESQPDVKDLAREFNTYVKRK